MPSDTNLPSIDNQLPREFQIAIGMAQAATQYQSQEGIIYATAVQLEQLKSVVDDLRSHESKLVRYVSVHQTAPTPASIDETNVNISKENQVDLNFVVRSIVKVCVLLFTVSLASWLYAAVPLINPFVSILGLITCPFFYAMANASENSQKK